MRVIVPSAEPDEGVFTRASVATYIDETGVLMTSGVNQPRYQDGRLLLEATATNRLLRSEAIDDVTAWSRAAGATYTVLADSTAAPDGAMTADTISMTAAGSSGVFQTVAVSASTTYTFSWFARRSGDAQVRYRVYNNSGGTDIVASTSYYSSISASEWTRVSVSFTTPVGCTSIRVYVVAGDSVVSSGAIIWGTQLELGPVATSYIPTTSGMGLRAADSFSGKYMVSFAGTPVGLPIQLLDEDPTPAWVSGATYSVRALVHRASTHRVYRRAVAGAGTTPPESDSANWTDLRATQRWAPLALAEDSRAIVIGNLYFTMVSAQAGVGLLLGGIRASAVRVVALAPPFSSVAFDQTYTLPPQSSAYSTGNEPVLAVALPSGLPAGSQIHVTLIGAGSPSTSWLRYLALGRGYTLGGTLKGSRIGIADYSRKETDEFGTTTLVQRGYAKRLSLEMTLLSGEVQSTFAVLADLRATPAMWVPADGSDLSWLATYGWLKDWGITVQYSRTSLCSLEIEGLI